MARIATEARQYPGLILAELAPLPGGAGVRVEVEDSGTSDLSAHPVFSAANARLLGVSGAARARLQLERGHRMTATSRDADSWMYWGGARILIAGDGCSSGFAVGNFWGEQAMLTAGHCSLRWNGITVTNGAGTFMGTTNGAVQANGGMVSVDSVRVTVSGAQGRIYDGGVGWGEFSKAVKGWGENYVGLFLCTSGSYSGARCDIRVAATGVRRSDIIGVVYLNLVKAEQVNHLNAAGFGDSGGPVFSLVNGGADTWARGIISSGDIITRPAPCTGVVSENGSNRKCSWTIYFNSIGAHLNAHGMWLITY